MNTKLINFSKCIWYLPSEERTDRPCLYYVKGDRFSIAIDAGNSKAHVDLFYEELNKNNLPLPEFTIITHWHWDHTFGMVYTNGKTVTGEKTHKHLINVSQWEWTSEAMKKRLEKGEDIYFCDTCIKEEYQNLSDITVVTGDIVVKGEMSFFLGGLTCRLFEMDSPHCRDSVFIEVKEEKVIFLGDADGEDYYDNNGTYDKERVRTFLNYLKSTKAAYFMLGHDGPTTYNNEIEYMEQELSKIKE